MKPKRGVQRIETDEVATVVSDDSILNNDELSLEELSAAYSKLINEPAAIVSSPTLNSDETAESKLASEADFSDSALSHASDDACVVTGRSILEAVLFVGNSENAALKPDAVAGLMRGVQASEVVEWIAQLNQHYIEQGHVMRIVEVDQGYRMQLASEYLSIRDSMNGKLRETQLNQAAIDCLALTAYRPGITREEVEQLWNRPAGSVLGLLVRRELLRIEKEGKGKGAVTRYFPTERFLNLVGITSLADLPTAESEFE